MMQAEKNITLLIVEDSPEDRQVYMAYLDELANTSFTYLEAEDTRQALSILNQAEVDCILLDQRLPDALGTDFIDRLYETRAREQLPIVMITGRGSEQVAVTAMKRGAVDYIPKEAVAPENLGRAVRHACQIKDLAAQLAEESYARRLAEIDLQTHETSLKALFESIESVAIVTLDPQGHVLTWSIGARNLFDYHDHDIVGRHADIFVAAEKSPAADIRGQMAAVRSGGQRTQQRYFRRRQGGHFFGSSVMSPILDNATGIRAFAWVVHALDEGAAADRGAQEA